MTVALPDLSKLAEESGLDKRVGLFLRDKGVTNSGVLGHLFGDRSKIAKMLEPLKTGITMGTETIKLKDEEIDVTEAIIDHMVDQIELARKKQFATAAPGTPPSTPALTTPVTTATGDGKAPKQLPKGFWAKRIKEFEATKDRGPPPFVPGPPHQWCRRSFGQNGLGKGDDEPLHTSSLGGSVSPAKPHSF